MGFGATGVRLAAIATAASLVCAACAAPAAAQAPAPFAPWNGDSPFNCTLQDAGTGPVENVPDPAADPFCVEFDKNSQSLAPEFGILEFLLNEPGRVAAAAPKCFYYQSDHWTGSLVQGQQPELWHWDGQYFFDKATGSGGVNLQSFRVGGQPANPESFGQVPAVFAPYVDQGGGGAYVLNDIPADPACAAKVDTPEERARVYAGGHPPPVPGPVFDTAACAVQNRQVGSDSADELIGGGGGDVLEGLGGRDLLVGAEGDDCLHGQSGADRLRGGPGADQLNGGRGRDLIKARDGARDVIRCGGGRDRVLADAGDSLRGCERVKR
jgi:RTX calcium-binding nonapeptide repeat (4 copies)